MKQTNAVEPPVVANDCGTGGRQRLEAWTGRFDLFREGARGAAMSRTDTLLTMPSIRSDRAVPRSLGSLIEVPEVKCGPTRRARPRAVGHWQNRQTSPVRLKRRLRREVRVGGYALLALAPLLAACTLGWSGRPARVLACSIAEATAPDQKFEGSLIPREPSSRLAERPNSSPGEVVLSIEPAVIAPGTDTEFPVVFPGYVLPDDSLEGSTHEGS